MALPSSPPLLPSDDFNSDLPTAPTFTRVASGSSASIGPLERKRQFSDYSSLSSDPIFSDTTEDDDAAHDAAERPRRKKVVRGPWWHVGKRGGSDLRRGMAKKGPTRNVDSGVWMGSDGSESSSGDSIISYQQRMQELAMAEEEAEGAVEVKAAAAPDAPPAAEPNAEFYAAKIIQMCLDGGYEAVDLSDLELKSISDATLRPLHQLIKSSFTTFTQAPDEEEFKPLTPDMKLILSRNQLKSLPAELFNLRNITMLSLRSNLLTELPSAIARLTKLVELNVAGNSIRYLPWELLDLMASQSQHPLIAVRPNPLLQPYDLSSFPYHFDESQINPEDLDPSASQQEVVDVPRAIHMRNLRDIVQRRFTAGRKRQYLALLGQVDPEAGEVKRRYRKAEALFLVASEVRYFGVDGRPLRRVAVAEEEDWEWEASADPYAHAPEGADEKRVPSLFELALRGLQAGHDLSDFSHPTATTAAEFGFSPSVLTGLQHASQNVASHGNDTCSTCGKSFVVARAEWVEYWVRGTDEELRGEEVLPFMRRVCSWGCAVVTEEGTFRRTFRGDSSGAT